MAKIGRDLKPGEVPPCGRQGCANMADVVGLAFKRDDIGLQSGPMESWLVYPLCFPHLREDQKEGARYTLVLVV